MRSAQLALGPPLGRHPLPTARSGARQAGFLLPLSALLALFLVLASLSLQTLSLQGRLRLAADRRLRQAEDELLSAAHALVAAIQLRHACLLPLAQQVWPQAGCATPTELLALGQGELWGSRWQLLSWQPQLAQPSGATAMELVIELQPAGAGSRLRSAFAVRLQGQPWRVRDLRHLGLRGRAS